jgi:hypothetical protein
MSDPSRNAQDDLSVLKRYQLEPFVSAEVVDRLAMRLRDRTTLGEREHLAPAEELCTELIIKSSFPMLHQHSRKSL